jgi:hypothetical protein
MYLLQIGSLTWTVSFFSPHSCTVRPTFARTFWTSASSVSRWRRGPIQRPKRRSASLPAARLSRHQTVGENLGWRDQQGFNRTVPEQILIQLYIHTYMHFHVDRAHGSDILACSGTLDALKFVRRKLRSLQIGRTRGLRSPQHTMIPKVFHFLCLANG